MGARCRAGPRPAIGSGRELNLIGWVNTLRLAHLLLPARLEAFQGRYLSTRLNGRDDVDAKGTKWTAAFDPPTPCGMYEPGAW